MRQLRMHFHELFERADETQVIFSGLQITDRKNERRIQAVSRFDSALRKLSGHGTKFAGHAVREHGDLFFVETVRGLNAALRKLGYGEHSRGGFHRTAHRAAQLQRAEPGEIFGMLEKTHVMHADHDRRITKDGRGVLDVQEIRMVQAQPAGNIEPQPDEGIDGYTVLSKPIRQLRMSVGARKIRHELTLFVEKCKTAQYIADVCFVPRQVLADRMSVYRKAHLPTPV